MLTVDPPLFPCYDPGMTDSEAVSPAFGSRLIHGDCHEALATVPHGSVALMVTSPPYFMGKDYDRSMSVADFEEEIGRVQAAIMPLIAEGGSLCWQVGSHVVNNSVIPLDILVYNICARDPDLVLRNRIVWTFEHGINSSRRFNGRHETVLWFTKGDRYTFDLDAVRVPQKYPGKRAYKGPRRGEYSGNPLGKNPGDVWALPNVKSNHVEKTGHPCQFPVGLITRLIRATTEPGQTVLDPFAGSGTTAIAALETGRKYICVEREAEYFRIADDRVKAWHEGSLRIRDDAPPAAVDLRSAVARRPDHFSEGLK